MRWRLQAECQLNTTQPTWVLVFALHSHEQTQTERQRATAKAGDKAGFKQADDRWQQNGVEIADFLSKANPNWPRETLVAMMKKHLATTTTEVEARLNKNWNDDVKAFDAVYDHILNMSDALADGIVKQFPEKFGKSENVTN